MLTMIFVLVLLIAAGIIAWGAYSSTGFDWKKGFAAACADAGALARSLSGSPTGSRFTRPVE